MCARCDDLEEEVAYLRSELGLVKDSARFASVQRELRLSPSEAALVLRLYDLKGKPLSRSQLLESLPNYDEDADCGENLISVYVAKIRAKLGRAAILTFWGRGFTIGPDASNRVAAILSEDRVAA